MMPRRDNSVSFTLDASFDYVNWLRWHSSGAAAASAPPGVNVLIFDSDRGHFRINGHTVRVGRDTSTWVDFERPPYHAGNASSADFEVLLDGVWQRACVGRSAPPCAGGEAAHVIRHGRVVESNEPLPVAFSLRLQDGRVLPLALDAPVITARWPTAVTELFGIDAQGRHVARCEFVRTARGHVVEVSEAFPDGSIRAWKESRGVFVYYERGTFELVDLAQELAIGATREPNSQRYSTMSTAPTPVRAKVDRRDRLYLPLDIARDLAPLELYATAHPGCRVIVLLDRATLDNVSNALQQLPAHPALIQFRRIFLGYATQVQVRHGGLTLPSTLVGYAALHGMGWIQATANKWFIAGSQDELTRITALRSFAQMCLES